MSLSEISEENQEVDFFTENNNEEKGIQMLYIVNVVIILLYLQTRMTY